MITLDDMMGMTDLTEEEIAAIGLHERCDMPQAAALGDYLMRQHRGPQRIQLMICEDIREALRRDDLDRARALCRALHDYVANHPECARGACGDDGSKGDAT